MTGNSILLTLFAAITVGACAFAAGALYQWYRHALERHDAWRDGYDQASGSLFKLAARVGLRRPGETTADILAVVQNKKPVLTTAVVESEMPIAGGPPKVAGVSAVTRPADPCEATVSAITSAPSYGGRHSFELRYEETKPLPSQQGKKRAI